MEITNKRCRCLPWQQSCIKWGTNFCRFHEYVDRRIQVINIKY